MRSFYACLGAICLLMSAALGAQSHATPESPSQQGISNILGAGARAMGMGGAFTAVADDATAASWNPAGLAQISKPEFSIVYDHFSGNIDTQWNYNRNFGEGVFFHGENSFYNASLGYNNLNFLSFTYPFTVKGHPWTFELSYHRLSTFPLFTQSWKEDWSLLQDNFFLLVNEHDEVERNIDFSGGINAYGASLAFELLPRLRLGFTLNYLDADVTNKTSTFIETAFYNLTDGSVSLSTSTTRDYFNYQFSDFSADVGFQWVITPQWTLGGVYHTKVKADIETQAKSFWIDTSLGYVLPEAEVDNTSELTWPDGWALGLSFRPIPTLTLAADYSVFNWSDAKISTLKTAGFIFDEETQTWQPAVFTGKDMPFPYLLEQEDTYSIRLGAEYVYLPAPGWAIPFRVGYFQEKQMVRFWEPRNNPVYQGITLGTGFTYHRFQWDIAWVHTWGEEKGRQETQTNDITDVVAGSMGITNNRLLVSLIFRID